MSIHITRNDIRATGSDANDLVFVCEVGTVDTESRTTGWREVVRYADENDAMNFVACNSHCVCRYRPIANATEKPKE